MSSFLRKRSRSQLSSCNGEDGYGAGRFDRKESNDVERRYSSVSLRSDAADYELDDSCVLRNFPKHKSSHLRFLAWVAYTRKYTDQPITDDERRTCPLLWCRTIFPDQEAMLKHVWECEHLHKGLYWCFHCQKPERVGRFQCRRCQGLPSKADRLATITKRIFSKLGTKTYKDEFSVPSSKFGGVTSTPLSRIPETSRRTNTEKFPDMLGDLHGEPGQSMRWPDSAPLPELPSNCISEMENTYVMPEMSTGWSLAQEASGTQAPEENTAGQSVGAVSDSLMESSNTTFSESNAPWGPSSFDTHIPTQRALARSMPALPLLNTRDVYQPPSAGQRRDPSSAWSDEPMSATIISPLSETDGFYSGMLGMSSGDMDVSPTDTWASGNSIPTDSGYSSATTLDSAWGGSTMNFDRLWEKHERRQKSDLQIFPVSLQNNFAGAETGLMKPPLTLPISASDSPKRTPSNSSTSSTHSANRCTSLVKVKSLSPHWTDAQSLVESFVEVLNEHVEHSRTALKQMPPNSVVNELLAISSTSIISLGFDTLRDLLQKRNPTAFNSIFAFTHVAYALAIATDHDSLKVQTEMWYQDSLSWLSGISSERHRQHYNQIAEAIWKPRNLSGAGNIFDWLNSTEVTSPEEAENRLIRACKHFLDIQESFPPNEKTFTSCSISRTPSFTFSPASFYRTAKSRIIDELIQKVSIEAFIEDVVEVEKRLRQGLIKSLRELELALICAGKLASQSDVAYERFIDHVTCLCDVLYSEGESERSRQEYQLADIDITKKLVPEDNISEDDAEHEHFDLYVNLLPGAEDINESPDASVIEFNESLTQSYLPSNVGTPISSAPVSRSTSHNTANVISARPPSRIPTASTLSSPFPPPPSASSASSSTSKLRCYCGYEPRGEEKWKASNLARHKRIQHAADTKTYRCTHLGCLSTFTRSDNLRSHQRDKGHAEDRGYGSNLDDGKREFQDDRDGEEVVLRMRPSKRRKMDRIDLGL